MPRKKKTYRRRAPYKGKHKRYGKKKAKTFRKHALLSPGRGYGLAPTGIIKFRYAQYNNVQSATNPYAEHVYRLNSINDPDFTGAGGQPVYHDDLALLYDRYKVMSAYVKITIENHTTSVPVIVSVTRSISNPSGQITAYNVTIPEANQDSQVRTLTSYGSGNAKSSTVFYVRTNMRRFLKTLYNDNNAQATMNANPTTTAYLRVSAQSLDSATAVQTRVNFELVQTCILTQRDLQAAVDLD